MIVKYGTYYYGRINNLSYEIQNKILELLYAKGIKNMIINNHYVEVRDKTLFVRNQEAYKMPLEELCDILFNLETQLKI